MSDLPPSRDPILETFEGAPVIRTTVSVTQAGDGLSDSMAIQPRLIRRGSRLRVIMDVVATKVEHAAANKAEEADPDAPQARKVTLAAETVQVLDVGDSAHVDQLLAHQREAVAEHKEQERLRRTNEERLPGTEPNLAAVPDPGDD